MNKLLQYMIDAGGVSDKLLPTLYGKASIDNTYVKKPVKSLTETQINKNKLKNFVTNLEKKEQPTISSYIKIKKKLYDVPSVHDEESSLIKRKEILKKDERVRLQKFLNNQGSFSQLPEDTYIQHDYPFFSDGAARERIYNPNTLKYIDIASDVMQYGNYIPHPLAQGIGKAGNILGTTVDGYQAIDAMNNGDYDEAAINAASILASIALGAKGYRRDMYNTEPGSFADKIASFGNRDGNYVHLTALSRLKNDAAVKKGIYFNRALLGSHAAETAYDSYKTGGSINLPKAQDGRYVGYFDNGGIFSKIKNKITHTDPINFIPFPKSLMPSNAKSLIRLAAANIGLGEGVPFVQPNDMSKEQLDAIKKAATGTKNRTGALKNGDVKYSDYDKNYGNPYSRPLTLLTDPIKVAQTTIGRFGYGFNPDNSVNITDKYDFEDRDTNSLNIFKNIATRIIGKLDDNISKNDPRRNINFQIKKFGGNAYDTFQFMDKGGKVLKKKNSLNNNGYVDLKKLYNLDPFSKEGILKAKELTKLNPKTKIVCTAAGCSEIAVNAAQAFGNNFIRGNAWDLGNLNNILSIDPEYANLIGKGILPNPKNYVSSPDVYNHAGAIIGLNRKNNLKTKEGKSLPDSDLSRQIIENAISKNEANDSYDYANQSIYPNSRGYEHVGYMVDDSTMLHGTGADELHPAFYVVDNDLKNGAQLSGYGSYKPVEAISPGSLMKNIKNKAKSLLNFDEGGFIPENEELSKYIHYIKQKGGPIVDARGQWAHPGKITRIPSNQITMQGVPYPVLGIGNNGQKQMMYPNQEYYFSDADYVDEYPMMNEGGGILNNNITCSNCGWSWKASEGGADPFNCHKCGGVAEMNQGGEMIRRADGSYSRRGLWDNIRDNRGSGKKPTAEMLKQERKISQSQLGGPTLNPFNSPFFNSKVFLQPTSNKLPIGYLNGATIPSTERAISIGGENGEPGYLIPSFKYGKPLKDPVAEFIKTREHLGGPFDTWQEADEWEQNVRHPYVEKGKNIPTPLKKWSKNKDYPQNQYGGGISVPTLNNKIIVPKQTGGETLANKIINARDEVVKTADGYAKKYYKSQENNSNSVLNVPSSLNYTGIEKAPKYNLDKMSGMLQDGFTNKNQKVEDIIYGTESFRDGKFNFNQRDLESIDRYPILNRPSKKSNKNTNKFNNWSALFSNTGSIKN